MCYMHLKCACLQNILKKILSPKMCVDMTPKVSTSFRLGVLETACEVGLLCADSIPCMSACLENLQKKILSPKMCVEIFFDFFLNIQKCLVLLLRRQC